MRNKPYSRGISCPRCGADSWHTPTRPRCSPCTNARSKEWYAKNREYSRKKRRAWHAANPGRWRMRRRANPALWWAKQALGNARRRAARLSVPFDLTVDDLLGRLGNGCPIFGTNWPIEGGRTGNSPSVDRLDPTRGYVRDNIAIISYRANTIKQNATAQEIQRLATWMRDLGL